MEWMIPYITAAGFAIGLSIVYMPAGIIYAAIVGPNLLMLADTQVAAIGIACMFFAFLGRLFSSINRGSHDQSE